MKRLKVLLSAIHPGWDTRNTRIRGIFPIRGSQWGGGVAFDG